MTRASISRATDIRMREMVAERTRTARLEKLIRPLICRDFRSTRKIVPRKFQLDARISDVLMVVGHIQNQFVLARE